MASLLGPSRHAGGVAESSCCFPTGVEQRSIGALGVTDRPRLLILSENFPNAAFPYLGIWAQRMTLASRGVVEPRVIAPVPWVPPGAPGRWRDYRRTPRRREIGGVAVHHTRILHPVLHSLHASRARLAWPAVRRAADRLHREQPFDLIHAHFIFPDGVLAVRLGRRYGVPVITTEHAHWPPWMEAFPAVRRQVLKALPGIARLTAVSGATAAGVREVAGEAARVDVLPNVVDEETFTLRPGGPPAEPGLLLFVGNVRRTKGLDVLVRALALLGGRPDLRLEVAGDHLFPAYRREEQAVRALVAGLGLEAQVSFLGPIPPAEVARRMQRCALVVLPSRRESFGAVLVEALACGTPVVATRCGGPEDIVTDEVGRLVEPDQAEALAGAIDDVLGGLETFTPADLRAHALSRFGVAAARERLARLYGGVLAAV